MKSVSDGQRKLVMVMIEDRVTLPLQESEKKEIRSGRQKKIPYHMYGRDDLWLPQPPSYPKGKMRR